MRKQISVKFEYEGIKKTLKGILELGEMSCNIPGLKINKDLAGVWFDEESETIEQFSLTWWDSENEEINYEVYFANNGTFFSFEKISHLIVSDADGHTLEEISYKEIKVKVTDK